MLANAHLAFTGRQPLNKVAIDAGARSRQICLKTADKKTVFIKMDPFVQNSADTDLEERSRPPPTNGAADMLNMLQLIDLKFPNEILKAIIESPVLTGEGLKFIRLVNHTFLDFATPVLFDNICFSPIKQNLHNFNNFTAVSGFNDYVSTLYIDGTLHAPYDLQDPNLDARDVSPEFYARLAMQRFTGTGEDWPYSEQELSGAIKEAQCDLNSVWLAREKGKKLNGHQLARFVRGYRRWETRSHLFERMVTRDEFCSRLNMAFDNLRNVRRVVISPNWFRKLEQRQIRVCPGPAGRRFDAMHIPPIMLVSNHAVAVVYSLVRAMGTPDARVEELQLPEKTLSVAADEFAQYLPTLCFGPQWLECFQRVFAKLRHIDLHLSNAPDYGRCIEDTCLSQAIRAMVQVVSINLSFNWFEDWQTLLPIVFGYRMWWEATKFYQESVGVTLELAEKRFLKDPEKGHWGGKPLNPNPWPKLKRMTLAGLASTDATLVSLLRTVSPTLEHLSLDNVTLEEPGEGSWARVIDALRRFLPGLKTFDFKLDFDRSKVYASLDMDKALVWEEMHGKEITEGIKDYVLTGENNPFEDVVLLEPFM